MTKQFLTNAPDWIKETLPPDLMAVLNGTITAATKKSIQASIDADNVNDMVYNAKNPKEKTQGNPLDKLMKPILEYPFDYADKNRKFKCLAYLAIILPKKSSDLTSPMKKSTPTQEPAPMWYKYIYLYFKTAEKINSDNLYNLIFHVDQPINTINLIFSQIEKKCPDKLQTRTVVKKENDIKFYKSLSEDDKTKITQMVGDKKLLLYIKKYLFIEGNLERIFICNGSYKLAEYCVKMNKIDEFKSFVSSHRNYYSHMRGCHMIMPQFSEIYNYAYLKTQYSDKSPLDLRCYIRDHLEELVRHDFYREVQFMVSKGVGFTIGSLSLAMGTLDDNIINLLTNEEKQKGIDNLLSDRKFEKLEKLFEKGYKLTSEPLRRLYYDEKLPPIMNSLEILDHVHPNEKFDSIKEPLAVWHPHLLKKFLEKYSDRLEDKSIKSWNLKNSIDPYKYELACDTLGIPYSDQIQSLFISCFKSWTEVGYRENMLLYSLKYHVDVSEPKYIKKAMKSNNLSVVAALVRAGADPNSVNNWSKKVSREMYQVIMANI